MLLIDIKPCLVKNLHTYYKLIFYPNLNSNMLKRSNFLDYLKINVNELKKGYCKVSAEVRKDYLNMHNTAHGSFIFALADAAFELISNYERDSVALQISIYYKRPAKEGEKLIAEAYEDVEGKNLSLYRIIVKNSDEKIIAIAEALAYHINEQY
jgi:acyl-CoA thioesterase